MGAGHVQHRHFLETAGPLRPPELSRPDSSGPRRAGRPGGSWGGRRIWLLRSGVRGDGGRARSGKAVREAVRAPGAQAAPPVLQKVSLPIAPGEGSAGHGSGDTLLLGMSSCPGLINNCPGGKKGFPWPDTAAA